jgi:hypothetical protein
MAQLEEKVARLKERAAAQAARSRDDGGGGAAAAAARYDDKHQRSEALREAHLSRIKAKAGDEARKVRAGRAPATAGAGCGRQHERAACCVHEPQGPKLALLCPPLSLATHKRYNTLPPQVEEVTFINALTTIEKKAVLQQRLEEGEPGWPGRPGPGRRRLVARSQVPVVAAWVWGGCGPCES